MECRNISFKYPLAEKSLFTDISFQLGSPGFHALFGPSGVGKTSFAKLLTGDMSGYSGEIIPGGARVLFYTCNMERLPDWSDIGEHLEVVSEASRRKLIPELVELFGLSGCMNAKFSKLSLGQKNRINLLRYLLQSFDLLVMDESLANVDESTRERIILHMKGMFPEAYFLYISHNVVEVAKFCREILVLRDSRKSPQMVSVRGQDLQEGEEVSRDGLEKTMLEIMNAS